MAIGAHQQYLSLLKGKLGLIISHFEYTPSSKVFSYRVFGILPAAEALSAALSVQS